MALVWIPATAAASSRPPSYGVALLMQKLTSRPVVACRARGIGSAFTPFALHDLLGHDHLWAKPAHRDSRAMISMCEAT